MASVAFEAFLPEVMLEAPSVPQPVAINAIRNACYDFCWKSQLWNAPLEAVTFEANAREIELEPIQDSQIVAVMSVSHDNKRNIDPASFDALSKTAPDWATRTGIPEVYYQPSTDKLVLYPIPDTGGTLNIVAAFAPTRQATTIEGFVYHQHLETIKYGALWKLKTMFGQTWSDAQGALYYEQRFWQGVGAATVMKNRGNSRALLQVSPRGFV